MTAPEPTVCPTCFGTRVASMTWMGGSASNWRHNPCPDCCATSAERRVASLPELQPMELCEVCGEPTSTPPLCERHQRELDDDIAAKAYREGRYE